MSHLFRDHSCCRPPWLARHGRSCKSHESGTHCPCFTSAKVQPMTHRFVRNNLLGWWPTPPCLANTFNSGSCSVPSRLPLYHHQLTAPHKMRVFRNRHECTHALRAPPARNHLTRFHLIFQPRGSHGRPRITSFTVNPKPPCRPCCAPGGAAGPRPMSYLNEQYAATASSYSP